MCVSVYTVSVSGQDVCVIKNVLSLGTDFKVCVCVHVHAGCVQKIRTMCESVFKQNIVKNALSTIDCV